MDLRPFRQISVSELCNRAEIGRKTFYRHFSSVDQVLDQYFYQLSCKYKALTQALEEYNLEIICNDFFSFWERYRDELKTIQKSLGYGTVTSYILKEAHQVISYRSGKDPGKFAIYSTAGLCGLLEEWLSENSSISAAAFVKDFLNEQDNFQKTSVPRRS